MNLPAPSLFHQFEVLAATGGGLLASAPEAGEHLPSINPWGALAISALLVFVNGFFVAAEFALVKASDADPATGRPGRPSRPVASHMIGRLDTYLSATQLGITLTSLALGWLGEPAFVWLLRPGLERLGLSEPAIHSTAITAAFLTITILHIVLGELVPKSIAIRKSQGATLWTAIPLYVFYRLTFPAMWLLNQTANLILRLIGIPPVSDHDLGHSEEELRLLLAHTKIERRQGQLKRELLDNVFELSDRIVRQIMVPRGRRRLPRRRPTVGGRPPALARESGHTRFPLCEGDLDRVIGLVHIKD